MLAECVVAVGTMLIPLSIVLLATIDEFPMGLAIFLIIVGVVALLTGLSIAIRKEMNTNKRERRLDEREKRRRRIDKAYYITLIHIAEKLGVDIGKMANVMKGKLDEEEDDEL